MPWTGGGGGKGAKGDPGASGATGPAGPSGNAGLAFTAPPLVASLTWYNQGGNVAADDSSGFRITGTANQNQIHGLYKAASGQFDFIAAVNYAMLNNGTSHCGIFVTDGTKAVVFGVVGTTGAFPIMKVDQWSNGSTHNVNLTSVNIAGAMNPTWLRIKQDATLRTYYVSPDGIIWAQVWQESVTNYVTTTGIGVYECPTDGTVGGNIRCISFAGV